MRLKGLKFETLVKIAKDAGLDVPEPYGSGEEVITWYEHREYDKIEKRLETELKALHIIDLNYRCVYCIQPTNPPFYSSPTSPKGPPSTPTGNSQPDNARVGLINDAL